MNVEELRQYREKLTDDRRFCRNLGAICVFFAIGGMGSLGVDSPNLAGKIASFVGSGVLMTAAFGLGLKSIERANQAESVNTVLMQHNLTNEVSLEATSESSS